MSAIPVTLLYGGLCALLVTALGANISLIRMRDKLHVGAALSKRMQVLVRAHGNAAEWIPLGIVVLLALELSGVPSRTLHLFGGSFLAARLVHATGFVTGLRISAIGATLNYLVLLGMSGYALALHFLK